MSKRLTLVTRNQVLTLHVRYHCSKYLEFHKNSLPMNLSQATNAIIAYEGRPTNSWHSHSPWCPWRPDYVGCQLHHLSQIRFYLAELFALFENPLPIGAWWPFHRSYTPQIPWRMRFWLEQKTTAMMAGEEIAGPVKDAGKSLMMISSTPSNLRFESFRNPSYFPGHWPTLCF